MKKKQLEHFVSFEEVTLETLVDLEMIDEIAIDSVMFLGVAGSYQFLTIIADHLVTIMTIMNGANHEADEMDAISLKKMICLEDALGNRTEMMT